MSHVKFPYHPNIYQLEFGPIERNQDGLVCQVCGCVPDLYLDIMYTTEEVDCLCLDCVASGAAADKFDGDYIQDAESEMVSDPERVKNFFRTTPGYSSWQGEYWLACCDDFCNFIDHVGMDELNKMPEKEAILADYELSDGFDRDILEECLSRDGDMAGYLFQCRHCGKYRLHVDES